MLNAINDFLDESVVLPPGDWDSKNLLSMSEIKELRKRKDKKNKLKDDTPEPDEEKIQDKFETFETNPLIRAPFIFGGLINDIKNRTKWYLSDFKDGFNSQVFAAAVFIYFASLSGAIAFGGLLGEKTESLIGKSIKILKCTYLGTHWEHFGTLWGSFGDALGMHCRGSRDVLRTVLRNFRTHWESKSLALLGRF